MTNDWHRRGVCGAIILCFSLATAQQVFAQTFTWDGGAGTTSWGDGSNWLGGSAPISGSGTSLIFAGSTGLTANNNIGPLTVNAMTFDSTAGAFKITGSALSFAANNGDQPTLTQDSASAQSIANAVAILDNLLLHGSGVGSLTLSGVISGSGGITINQLGTGFRHTGSVTTLAAANTYTGGTTLTNGNVAVSNNASFGTGAVTVNGADTSLRFTTVGLTIPNDFTLNSTLNIVGSFGTSDSIGNSGGAVFAGQLSGNGGIYYAPNTVYSGSPTNAVNPNLIFTNGSTLSGPIVVKPLPIVNQAATGFVPGISLTSSAATDGTMLIVTSFTLYDSFLRVSDPFANITRINPNAVVMLNGGGGVNISGGTTVNGSLSIGSVISTGNPAFVVVPGSSASAELTVGTWVRQMNSTALFRSTNLASPLGSNVGNITITNDPGGAIGGGGLPGTPTLSILPYAFANVALTPQNSLTTYSSLVRWDGATGRIMPLDLTTEYAYNLASLGASAPNDNALVNASTILPSGLTSINALVIEHDLPSAAPYSALSISGSGTLHIGSGALLNTSRGGSPASFGVPIPSLDVATLDFGSATGHILSIPNLVINSSITGSGGLVVSEFGTVSLNGANSFSGGFTLNGGTVSFGSDSALGDPSNTINLMGGGSSVLTFAVKSLFGPATVTSLTTSRPVFLGPGGGGVAGHLTLAGIVSGSGNLYSSGSIVRLTNDANSFTGDIDITNGSLAAASAGALGLGDSIVFTTIASTATNPGTTTFMNEAAFTTNKNILLLGPGTIFSPTADLTITGGIGSQAPGDALNQAGSGTLTLTGVGTYDGATTIGDATGTLRAGSPSQAYFGGSLVLSGPNGSDAGSSGFTVNSGSSLVLDNSLAVNNYRIGPSASVTPNDGFFTLIGNAGSSVFQRMGALKPAGGNTVTINQPVSSSGQSTTLDAASFSPTPGSVTLFRGTNLGGSSGDYTRILFNTAPTLKNGIIQYAVGANTANGSPTDFVTYGPNGVQLLTAYGPASGGTSTNADISGSVYTGTVSVNSLRIGPGGGVVGDVGVSAGALLAEGGPNNGIRGTLSMGSGFITTGSDLTISNLSGSGTVTKYGSGTLTVISTSIFSGTMDIEQGTLRPTGSGFPFFFAAQMIVGHGATLDISAASLGGPVYAPYLSGAGTVILGQSQLIDGNTSDTFNSSTFSGSIIGSGTLTVQSTLTLNGISPGFTGTLSGGGLTIGTNGAIGSANVSLSGPLTLGQFVTEFTNNISVTSNATLSYNSGTTTSASGNIVLGKNLTVAGDSSAFGSLTFTGPISGAGTLIIGSSTAPVGNVNLWGNDTYTGGTQIDTSTGVIGIGSDTAFGSGLVSIQAASLRADNGARTLANNVTLTPNPGSLTLAGINPLTLTGSIDLGAGTARPLTVSTAGNVLTLSGVVSNGGIAVSGPGTVQLSNPANTYTGATAVNGGTLMVTGNIASSSGVAVNNGGTLAGTGTVTAITLNNGGILAPGGPGGALGTLTGKSLTWNGGAEAVIGLGFSSAVSDHVALSSFFNRGTSGTFSFLFEDAGGITSGQTYTLVSGWTSTTFSSTDFSIAPGGAVLSGIFAMNANSLTFTVSGVAPEPSTGQLWLSALCAAGPLTLAKCRRRVCRF